MFPFWHGSKSSGLGDKVVLYTDHCKVIEILTSLPIRMSICFLSENSRYLIFDRSEKCMPIHKEHNFPWLCLFWLLSLRVYTVYLHSGTNLMNFVFSLLFLLCDLYWYCIELLWLIYFLDDLSWVGNTFILLHKLENILTLHTCLVRNMQKWLPRFGNVKGIGWVGTSEQSPLLQRRKPPGLLPWEATGQAKTDRTEKRREISQAKQSSNAREDFVS